MAKRPRRPALPRGVRPAARHAPRPRRRRAAPVLLLVLATSPGALEDVVSTLIDLGIASTVLQTRALSSVLRDELPIFSGLASMLPLAPDGRLLMSVTAAPIAARALRLFAAARPGEARIIAAVLPIADLVGIDVEPERPRGRKRR